MFSLPTGYKHQMSFPCFTNISWSSCYKTFKLSFTITNMFYTTKMNQKDSRTFKAAEHILQILLKVLFGSSKLGSQYCGCSGLSLRSLKNSIATGVDILCTFKKDSSNLVLDKKVVSWELTEQLCRRELKHLVIDNDSLIVNGYQHKLPGIRSTKRSEVGVGPVTHIPDHGEPGKIMTSLTSGLLIRESPVYAIAGRYNWKTFILNFTITNMFYTTKMAQRDSSTFRLPECFLQRMFKVLFERSSLGSQYCGCNVILLRSMKNGAATGVEVICFYKEVFSVPVLDKKKIYQELSQETNGITRLGHYILDKKSLYVDGYNPQMMPPPYTKESVYHHGSRRWRKVYRMNGHLFQSKRFNRRAYCAQCSERIWCLGRQGYKCIKCKLLVHKGCHIFVPRTCKRHMDLMMPSQETQVEDKNDKVDLPSEENDGLA
ncbi:mucin-16-like [Monodelphis domestica]|uniref:mucin-16-like n=1 Tax=Monodelphis domestica TaxID=13616 RepID=UPI0024E262C4|nr:mucin-16-like [Monodelphis domestica]